MMVYNGAVFFNSNALCNLEMYKTKWRGQIINYCESLEIEENSIRVVINSYCAYDTEGVFLLLYFFLVNNIRGKEIY